MTFQPNFVKFTNTDVIGTEPLEGRFKGNQNDGFTYVRFADGSGGIIKTMKNWVGNKTGRLYPAEILAAQEYLASLVGETMNAPVRDCHFYGSGAKTVIMPFIVGQTGEEAGQTELPENAQGTALKLFDYLTANADRRPKNWISTPDGRIVGIDHALCNFRPRVLKPDFVSDLWNNGVSPESLLILQPKLANLAIDFHQIGMGDKHETMMQNLSQLIAAFQTLAKFATVVKSVVGADRIIVKGDEPGHPFRGNQYEVGSSEIHDWQKADGWQETRAAAPKVLDFIKQAIDQPPFTDTEIKGVIGYVATSRSMNEYLRTGKEPIDNFTKAGIEGVMSAMDKSITKEPMTVFRIMPKAELEATDVGRVVADKGFLSASLFQNRREPDENQVLIQINVPAGTHCIAPLADPKTAPSAYAEEAEVLFPPSTGLRLGGTNPNGNMVFTIDQSTKVTKGDLPGHKFHGNQWTGGNAELAKGAAEYAKSVGLQRPDIDYSKVKVNPSRALEIAKDYVALPSVDESTRAAYREFVKETHQQFEYLTKTLGVKVEVVKEDPYKDAAEMAADVHDNHHLAVLSASSTGGHPFVTNREIEEFRAVHDAFGHAATGRNFDRNGEEAAWASHASMYGPLARQAMTTATRGQNSVMTQLGGGFPEQKGALLPEKWSDPSTVGMSDDVVKSDGDIRPCFAGGRAQYDYQQSDVQKGDLDGHQFHGNQWVTVGGKFNASGGKAKAPKAAKAPKPRKPLIPAAKPPKAARVAKPKPPVAPKPKPVVPSPPPAPQPQPAPKPEPKVEKPSAPLAPAPKSASIGHIAAKSEFPPATTALVKKLVSEYTDKVVFKKEDNPEQRRATLQENLTNLLLQPTEYLRQRDIAVKNKSSSPSSTAILQMLGYSEKPTVLSEKQFANTPGQVLYSGLRNGASNIMTKLSQMYYGDVPRYGGGIYGAAFYTSPDKSTPAGYANARDYDTNGCIFRCKLDNPANVWQSNQRNPESPPASRPFMLDSDLLSSETAAYIERSFINEVHGQAHFSPEQQKTLASIGKAFPNLEDAFSSWDIYSSLPALSGFDAYHDHTNNYTMVLNRSSMILPENTTVSVNMQESYFGEGGALPNPIDGNRDGLKDVPVPLPDKVEKGDLVGHLFHGNQYTSGIQVATFLASALYRRAAKNEPGITKEIAETATEVGAQRIKPDKVLKSADSLARKITLDARDFVGPKSEAEQQASLTVKDSIRYTLALDEKKFSDGVKSALADLRKEGYETIAIRNYFNTDPHNSYKGINGLFRDPIKNQMFEVQFHTPESAAMATKTHGIYKRIRDLNPKDPAYIKGQAKMVKMWAKVSIPAGVEDIGTRSIKASAWTYYEYSTTEGKPFAYYRYDGTDAEAYVEGQWIPASAFLENWIEGNPLLTELDGPPEEAISKGDVPGHQFHGNQWLTVGGGFNTRGGKPSSAAKAPAKAPKAPKVKAPKVPRVPKAPKPVASPPEPKPEPKPKPEPTPPKAETPAPEPEFKSELSPKETAEIRQYVENASKDIPISGQLGDKSQDDARRALFAKNLTMVLCNPGEYNKQFKIAKEQRSNDPANAAILQMLGYGAKPKVVSEEEFAKVPTPCLFSGIKTGSTSVETKMSQLYYGKVPRYGGGFYGAAFYTSPEKYTPVQYTRSGRGGQSCIFRAKLESTSNTWTYDGLAYERPKGISLLPLMKQGITPDQASAYGKIDAVMTDYSMRMSVVPALAGFDALTASQAGTNNDDYTMLLNRGALVLPKNITVGNDIAFFEHTFDEKGARGKGLTDVPVEPYEKSVQKGDVDGHPFHGNQWTGGEGGSEISQAESKPGDNVSVYLNSRKVAEAVEKGLTGTKWDMTVRGDCKAAIAKDIASRLGTKFDEQLIGKWFFGPPEIRHNSMYELQDGQARYVNLYEAGSNQWDKLGPRTSEYDEDGEPIGKPTGEYVRGDDPRVITALREEGVSQLISEWANTSNDTSPLSLAMQQSATKEFGLAGHFDWNYDAAARETLLVPTNSENSTVKDLAEKTKAEVDKLVSEKGDFYRAFLRAQYNATQDYFKAAGIKEVSVYRGMEFSNGTKPDWAKVQIGGSTEIPLRPLSSFAYSLGEAEQFGHTIISGTVPVERVLSCARTGVGCLNEDEIVVMAGPGKWQVGGHRDFSKADLSGVHIKDIASTPDFSGANLEGATFESVLPEARFYNANLKNADFSPSNGKGVVFSSWFGTTFRGANLTGANFQNTHFDYTDFRGANLSGAKLDGAIFNRTESDENTVLPKGYSIVNGELVKQ